MRVSRGNPFPQSAVQEFRVTVGGQNPPLSALPNVTVPGFLSNIPVYEFTLGVIILVGLVYWAVAQRRAPESPTVQPAPVTAEAPA